MSSARTAHIIGVAYKDPEKNRAAKRAYYERNREEIQIKNGIARSKRRKYLAALANEHKDKPCADCGESYPYYVMDFDHVRGEKVANVGTLVHEAVPERRLLDEIQKCEVVCANCHRERTATRDQWLKSRFDSSSV